MDLTRYGAIVAEAKAIATERGYDPAARDPGQPFAPGVRGLGGETLYPLVWHAFMAEAMRRVDTRD